MRPCVRGATLDGYIGLARSLRLDPVELIESVGLVAADVSAPDTWLPAAAAARLLEVSAAKSGAEDFGLRLAEVRRLSTLGPLSVVLREEPDLRGVIELLTRYQRSYNEALRITLAESSDLATIRLWLEFGEPVPTRHALELAVGALHGIIRDFLGAAWQPRAICFSHGPPADLGTHHRLFGPRLQFHHEFSGLVLYASDLESANTMADPLLRPYAQQFLTSVVTPRAATTTDRVRELMEFLLPLGRCSMQQVSRNIGVDPRTLHRHLAEHGQTFTTILNATRAGLAERCLANERYSLTEVSQLLGFSSPSAFTRWFRDQFRCSPTEWRRAGHSAC